MQNNYRNIINIDEHLEYSLILAISLYKSGKIFIYPTDTLYGIGGNPFDKKVVQRITDLKGRNEGKKFIWLISDFENLLNYVEITFEKHFDFLQKIWPGPVSVVLNLNDRTREITHFESIAVRIPNNNFCHKLLKEIKQPLISTSTNKSGQEPINQIEQIIEKFSRAVDAIIFNSMPIQRISSTLIDLTTEQPKLIREGFTKFVELLRKFN